MTAPADRHGSGGRRAPAPRPPLVLLTGATGYIGGRLLPALEARGVRVRCLARRPEFLAARTGPGTEVVRGDLLDGRSVDAALEGVHAAYYLAHSLGSTGAFEEEERRAAEGFARAARDRGVRRIVYVGGLGRGDGLSRHLRSRHEVGRVLASTGVPVIELRASVVIGSGSLSFELVRALSERLPVMTVPRWTRTLAQPMAVEDLLAYLLESLDLRDGTAGVFEVGGPDRVSYLGLMQLYCRLRGLRRVFLPLPVLTPTLSSLWLGLVTPVYARVGRKLIESLVNETVVTDDAALRTFRVRPRGVREAMERALANEDREIAATRWSDAVSASGEPRTFGGAVFGSRRVDTRSVRLPVPPAAAFLPVRRIGGSRGYHFSDFLWRLRGLLDLLAGGPGLRRGRRDPEHLASGDALDFWRVEAVEPDRLLRLAAEMRLPGRAWLQFEVEPDGDGAVIRQTAIFDPVGLSGLLYWYGVWPLHALVFRGMLRGLARAAVEGAEAGRGPAGRR